jgi:hypothetical protein
MALTRSFAFWLSLLLNATFLWHQWLTPKPREAEAKSPMTSQIHLKRMRAPEDDWSGLHPLRLTHLIIPFHMSHLGKLEQMVRTWNSFLPCANSQTMAANYTLMFYSSTDMKKRDRIAEIESRLGTLMASLSPDVLRCFSGWHLQHANLSANSDTYYRGTRLMLEKIILNKVSLYPNSNSPNNTNNPNNSSGTINNETLSAGYGFYMEPDCLPLRSYWLTALDLQCQWPQQPFWLKGSIYRGSNKGVYATRHPPQFYHINGNALVNLGDRALRSFYVKHYKPWAQQSAAVRERSFDTDFWRFLHSLDNVHVVKQHYHKFAYTDVVQNWWRSSYSVQRLRDEHPGTYLVHGGYPKP